MSEVAASVRSVVRLVSARFTCGHCREKKMSGSNSSIDQTIRKVGMKETALK